MTVLTQVSAGISRRPYQGLTDPQRDLSAIPRGEIIFNGIGAAITDGDATGQVLRVRCVLPSSFAYALADVSLEISDNGTGANSFDDVARLSLDSQDPTGLPIAFYQMKSEGLVNQAGTALYQNKVYTICPGKPTFMLFNDQGEAPEVQIQVTNRTGLETGLTAAFFVRMYQYDIAQVFNWEPNVAQLVRP